MFENTITFNLNVKLLLKKIFIMLYKHTYL